MATARDYISGALRLLGVYQSGENPTAHEAKDGLQAFNEMLGSWSLERLMIPAKTRETFDLEPGKSSYTFGVGGDFDSQRPTRIEYANFSDGTTETGMNIMLADNEWSGLSQKSTTSTQPTDIYYESTAPFGTVNVYPVPSGAGKLVLTSWKPLESLTDLNSELNFPDGYALAIRFNLAIHLAPEYGRAVSGEVASVAEASKTKIKALNIKPEYFVSDAPGVRSGRMNIFSGEFD